MPRSSVPKVARAGEDHGDPALIRCGDHLLVSDRAARLDDGRGAGLADELLAAGVAVLGPRQAAARIEGSKIFAKALMDEARIPTAGWTVVQSPADALEWARGRAAPPVVKADGLMAGKGVIVPDTVDEVPAAVEGLLPAGPVLLEDRLIGPEVSVIGLCDGRDVLALPSARDHKRIYDGDKGPNTGGMGAISPAPGVDDALVEVIRRTVLVPALAALAARGTPFVGFLYAGVMLTPQGPRVLEFNCRLGDPEAQVLLARLRGDVARLFLDAANGQLAGSSLDVDPRAAACVVLAAPGYPGVTSLGGEISGLWAGDAVGAQVLHAGTRRGADGAVETAGGRVLGVTALGHDVAAAVSAAYRRVEGVRFPGMQFRKDIGATAH